MPRRNNRQTSRRAALEVEEDVTRPLTTDEMARRLVALGVADPIILGPLRGPYNPPGRETSA